MGDKFCILYGKNHFTTLRLGDIFKNKGFNLLYANNRLALKEHINLAQENLLCILVEIENNEEAVGLIEDAKANANAIPLIILSDDPKRDLFVKAILAGATDFIVKPFEESLLINRLTNLLQSLPGDNYNHNEAALEMIRIELRKSQKGKYPLAFGLITFFKPVKTYNAKLEQQYRTELPKVFNELGVNLFDTDVKLLIGSQSMLVALTFCESKQIQFVENKMEEHYKKFKNDYPTFNNYSMTQVFVSELNEVSAPIDVLNSLMNRTKEVIVDKKVE